MGLSITAKALISLLVCAESRRQPRQAVANFSMPDVLAMAPVENIKVAAQLEKEVSRLRGGQTLHDAAPADSNPLEEYIEKPFMDQIHVFRMMMCWERPDLIEHRKCMNYMAHHCATGRSGKGYCEKLVFMLERMCSEGDDRAVAYARKLNVQCSSHDEDRAHTAMEELEAAAGDEEDPNAEVAPGPAPGPMGSPGPAPGPAPMITNLDKSYRPLPQQGYDEFSSGDDAEVMHENMKTYPGDWRKEWPDNHETEGQSVERICQDQPDHDWCKLYLKDRQNRNNYIGSFDSAGGRGKEEEEGFVVPDSHAAVHEDIEEADKDAHEAEFDREPKHDDVLDK